MIFLIAMGADYSFYVKPIATFALTFFGYIISVLASVVFFYLDNVLFKKPVTIHSTISLLWIVPVLHHIGGQEIWEISYL